MLISGFGILLLFHSAILTTQFELKKLPRSFYFGSTLRIAKALLGKHIVRNYRGNKLVGRIVEVEAYRGSLDPASHAYHGRTKRNEVMFWEGGHLYVYFTYGMHFCANVVTRGRGIGEAVLIRAVEPFEGIEIMRRLRGRNGEGTNLSSGPANFCQAFGIKRPQNGIDLLGENIYLLAGEEIPNSQIQTTTRVGIRKGTEKKWRFCVKGNPWVSGAGKNSGR